ncbi:MAG TPA: class I SAM-dependent methyltransferase [Solirubrobacteraceae bacterium]|nr:class I SAM-dependent methyltransferase [Solirubrobacteraceae bacterium]
MSRADAAIWDRLAARYPAQEHLELRAIDAALRLAAPQPDERLVDLGTGTGLVLRRLAAAPHAPREAVGVDHSSAMLARVGTLPVSWHVLEQDARAVALPSAWADVVTCAYLLHLLESRERAAVLAGARRLLAGRPRPRLVAVTVFADRPAVAAVLRTLARLRPSAWQALRPLDPTSDLVAAGFAVTRRAVLPRGGYPSLVVVAAPAVRPTMPGIGT